MQGILRREINPFSASVFLVVAIACLPRPTSAQTIDELDRQVAAIFGRSCAQVGCHAGSDPQMGLSLIEGRIYANAVVERSLERPDLLLVDPGNPDDSYLVMKIRGDPDIVGLPMPFAGERLSEQDVATIEAWVQMLGDVDVEERKVDAVPRTATAFDGWKVVNLPTTRMVDRRRWLFLIGHRFNPEIATGYDTFFGLDGSAVIFLGMGYAPTDRLLVMLARSNASANVELQTKYRFVGQALGRGPPLSVAAQAGVNWITETVGNQSSFRSEAFKVTGQLVLTRELARGIGVAVVPGILFNPNEHVGGESPLLTLGIGGRWLFYRNLSLVGEWVPILSGFTRTRTLGNVNRFDSWGGGLEIRVGGHVFQIVVTNSLGLTTDQYMRGGDLDLGEGELRLGFNIFRMLRF